MENEVKSGSRLHRDFFRFWNHVSLERADTDLLKPHEMVF